MTGRDAVSASLRKIGALAPGESLASQEATDGLAELNRMLGSWTNEGLLISGVVREEFTLTPSDGSYTIGTGADFSTTRPHKIVRAGVRVGLIEYPMVLITVEGWANISTKSVTSTFPRYLYSEGTFPNETLNLFPIPAAANILVLYSEKPLTEIATLDTSVSLPVGYDDAIIYNLAIRLASEYGKSVGPEVAMIASDSLAGIKRTNHRPQYLKADDGLITNLRGFNLVKGEYW